MRNSASEMFVMCYILAFGELLRGGAGRKTVLLIFQPTHFIVHLL